MHIVSLNRKDLGISSMAMSRIISAVGAAARATGAAFESTGRALEVAPYVEHCKFHSKNINFYLQM